MDGFNLFYVVVNHEQQYSIWPSQKELPLGWQRVGFEGDKEACLAHIQEIWSNVLPVSLQQ